MYKLLMVALVSPHLSLEDYKTLMSELTEVLPCILRQETLLLPSSTYKAIATVRVPGITDYDRRQVTSAFVAKM